MGLIWRQRRGQRERSPRSLDLGRGASRDLRRRAPVEENKSGFRERDRGDKTEGGGRRYEKERDGQREADPDPVAGGRRGPVPCRIEAEAGWRTWSSRLRWGAAMAWCFCEENTERGET